MSAGVVTIGALRRLRTLLAGQSANSVAITGGSISGTSMSTNTFSGNINSDIKRVTTQLDATSNTTLANIAGLSQTVVPGTYLIRIFLAGTSGASGGWKVAFNLIGTVITSWQVNSAAYTASALSTLATTTTTTNQTSLIAATAAITSATIDAIAVIGTGGTMQLQFAQNASNATASSIYVNSYMQFQRIA